MLVASKQVHQACIPGRYVPRVQGTLHSAGSRWKLLVGCVWGVRVHASSAVGHAQGVCLNPRPVLSGPESGSLHEHRMNDFRAWDGSRTTLTATA